MSKRKKKNAMTLLSLLIALVALIGFYYWYSNKDQSRDKGTDQAGITKENEALVLAELDKTLINALNFKNENMDIGFYLENEVWKSVEDPNRPIMQDKVNILLDLVDEVRAKKMIHENPVNLEEYGLAEPSVYLQAVQTDQKTLSIKIGDSAIGGEGYYALIDDRKEVYLLGPTYGTGISYMDTDITAVEGEPDIDSGNIYHIEVKKKDGDNFELLYDTKNQSDNTQKGMFPWVLLQPYEEGYSADGSKVSEILPDFAKFDFIACVDYMGENLAQYGLEDPMASILVEYYETYMEELEKPETDPSTGKEITEKNQIEEKRITVYIGNEDGNGNYYIRRDDSNSVFTIKAEAINKMLQVEAFSLMTSFVTLPYIDNINRIDVTIEDKPYSMEIERETVKDDKGEEVTQGTYYFNGEVVEEQAFKNVYQYLIRASYDAKITGDVISEDLKPFMTITYYVGEDDIITNSYLSYNESFYIINNGNPLRFFADKRKIDEIAQVVIEFNGLENE